MNADKVAKLFTAAKYEFDHGSFTALKQADFFVAMASAVAEEPPPPPAPPPPTVKK